MPWRGISELIDAYGRMRVRVRAATAQAAVAGARVIRDEARANILARFRQHTGRLYISMYADPIATPLGPDSFSARAFPRGPRSAEGTPYGRIQELGGTIRGEFGRDQKLWFDSLRDDGTFGVISVDEVTLQGKFYLRDAVLDNLGTLRETAVGYWRAAL